MRERQLVLEHTRLVHGGAADVGDDVEEAGGVDETPLRACPLIKWLDSNNLTPCSILHGGKHVLELVSRKSRVLL